MPASTGERGRWPTATPAAAVVVAVVVLLACLPSCRAAVVLLVSAAAALAPLVGMHLHRPSRRAPWVLSAVMLGLWGAAGPLAQPTGGPGRTTSVLVVAGEVVAVALVGVLFARRRRDPAPAGADPASGQDASASAHPHADADAGRGTDALLLSGVVVLALAQVVVTTLGRPAADSTSTLVAPAVDVLIGGLLVRFLASRAQLGPSNVLSLVGSLVAVAYSLLGTASGHVAVAPGEPVAVVWALAACLFALAALHPSMAVAFDAATRHRRRSESGRLLGLVPLAVLPVALYLVGGAPGQARLPTLVYLAAGVLVTAVGLLRGAEAVRTSEDRAERDPLTGLANRRGLARAFTALVESPMHGAGQVHGWLCLLDVDDFKQVNDTLGHDAGDALLCEVGARLQAAVGGRGTVARSGGDEFVVLLDDATADAPALVMTAFTRPFTVGRHQREVRTSAGARPVEPGATLAHVLADADVALYAAKAEGKDALATYAPQMREDVLGRLALVADLRRVLDGGARAGALHVRYQPLVELGTGRTAGAEALVRWEHPTRGLLGPDAFLPLAEGHGLATALDRWVLDGALAQLTRWDGAGLRLEQVSVNLGRSSMLAPDLAEHVLAALTTHGLDPARLHLEITEHEALPAEAGAAALHVLAARGVGVSLDDFGTGYTSLDYLRRYPVGLIKLDRSITRALETETSSPLVEGIASLARCLGIPVLAEGIETAAQQQRLTALGTTYGQGFHIAHPLTPDQLALLLAAVPAPVATGAVGAVPAGA